MNPNNRKKLFKYLKSIHVIIKNLMTIMFTIVELLADNDTNINDVKLNYLFLKEQTNNLNNILTSIGEEIK